MGRDRVSRSLPIGVRLVNPVEDTPMTTLRVIGDVHGQIDPDDLLAGYSQSYLAVTAGAAHSVQIGDLGNGDAYDRLIARVDANHHRFFPGNHDNYDRLPPHNLGDF